MGPNRPPKMQPKIAENARNRPAAAASRSAPKIPSLFERGFRLTERPADFAGAEPRETSMKPNPRTPLGTWWCSGCQRARPEHAFGINGDRKTGLNSQCKRCRAAKQRERYRNQVGGELRPRGTPVPLKYRERREGMSLRAAAARFRVDRSVIRRWDAMTGYVSPWAAVKRRNRLLRRVEVRGMAHELGVSTLTIRTALGAWRPPADHREAA